MKIRPVLTAPAQWKVKLRIAKLAATRLRCRDIPKIVTYFQQKTRGGNHEKPNNQTSWPIRVQLLPSLGEWIMSICPHVASQRSSEVSGQFPKLSAKLTIKIMLSSILDIPKIMYIYVVSKLMTDYDRGNRVIWADLHKNHEIQPANWPRNNASRIPNKVNCQSWRSALGLAVTSSGRGNSSASAVCHFSWPMTLKKATCRVARLRVMESLFDAGDHKSSSIFSIEMCRCARRRVWIRIELFIYCSMSVHLCYVLCFCYKQMHGMQ